MKPAHPSLHPPHRVRRECAAWLGLAFARLLSAIGCAHSPLERSRGLADLALAARSRGE
jgi:hypothetical protein